MLTAKDLTTAERLILARRRARETQAQAAERLGVSLYRYTRWETGQDDGGPRAALGRLQVHEVCHVLRRRAGLTVAQVAELAELSEWWVSQIEQGEDVQGARLEDFWQGCRWSPRSAARKAARARQGA